MVQTRLGVRWSRLQVSSFRSPAFYGRVLGWSIVWVLPFILVFDVTAWGLRLHWNLLLVSVPLVGWHFLRSTAR